ncbi:two-component sensor histidine kinase [Streptomyces flavofungini]|uniref:histidine kinase n=1 Tax=Streptomyces flavofungini TaxID=68200 RepID=A0ABS0X879_9ACTN|nr:two-component sensor histidine kinase [Streptomyces flavofungini]GHC78102.1 two-component sensor histidine kinase [Streptomyces flavofungini]
MEPVFDRKYAPVRVLVVAGALLGYLLLVQRPAQAADWGFAAAGIALCLAEVEWVFAAAVAQSGLLVAAHAWGAEPVAALKVLAALGVFEVSVRCAGRRPVVASAALACAVAANRLGDLPGELPSVLYKMSVVAGVPLVLGAYVRATRDATHRARDHAEQEQARAEQRLLAARTAERTAIARELHDLVAHHVSSMVVRVGVARHVLPAAGTDGAPDPRITAVLDDLHTGGTAAMADLRRLVAVLRDPDSIAPDASPLLSPGALATALESVVAQSARSGLLVDAAVDDAELARIDTARGLAVLRLAQEGLANVTQHAGAGARAGLTVGVGGDGGVWVVVEDDGGGAGGGGGGSGELGAPGRVAGVGPSGQELVGGPSGHGLVGLRERVRLLGGRLEAGPVGRGWRLRAELPVLDGGAATETVGAMSTAGTAEAASTAGAMSTAGAVSRKTATNTEPHL